MVGKGKMGGIKEKSFDTGWGDTVSVVQIKGKESIPKKGHKAAKGERRMSSDHVNVAIGGR